MNAEKKNELIAKKLSENISDEENVLLKQWLDASSENADTFEKAQLAWFLTAQQTVPADTDEAWNKLGSLIQAKERKDRGKIISTQWIGRIAAVLVLVFGIGFLFSKYYNQPHMKTIASADKTMKVLLPDSSIVWLNKNSEISFNQKFTTNKREVKLKGEAYFEVMHDIAQPFIVLANNTITEDIGTSFNMRAVNTEPTVEVTVATGEVSFTEAGDKNKIHLLPGDKGVFNRSSHQLSVSKNNDANFLAWKTNKLIFEKNTLREVALTISKYYNISFTANEETANILFTGTFDRASISDVIKILETSTGIQISKQQNGYIISAK